MCHAELVEARTMSIYRDELESAKRQGRAAHEAMEQWVARPADAPDDTPASVLEEHARALRASREKLRELYYAHGNRDDIMQALDESEAFHRGLGLSIRDKPEAGGDQDDG